MDARRVNLAFGIALIDTAQPVSNGFFQIFLPKPPHVQVQSLGQDRIPSEKQIRLNSSSSSKVSYQNFSFLASIPNIIGVDACGVPEAVDGRLLVNPVDFVFDQRRNPLNCLARDLVDIEECLGQVVQLG